MAQFIDCDMQCFFKHIQDKKIIAFGAGRKFMKSVKNFSLEQKVEFVVDNDIKKWGKDIEINGKLIPIEGMEKLLNYKDRSFVILITNENSFAQIMEQINRYDELEPVECYCISLIQDRCVAERVAYTKGKQKIPKIIHYCWFGGKEIPDYLRKYMESWKKFCPDYEIVCWDESNYDVTKNQYMRQAYENKKWGFVPDYARLDIVATYGGIYLDTDVEIVKSFDDLLSDESFFGFHCYDEINLGVGFGAAKENPLILELKNDYRDRSFIKEDGSLNLMSCVNYQDPVFAAYGFQLNNKQQKINGNVVYPSECFSPLGVLGINKLFTEQTHSIHYGARTWETEENKRDFLKLKENFEKKKGERVFLLL